MPTDVKVLSQIKASKLKQEYQFYGDISCFFRLNAIIVSSLSSYLPEER